jgi:hypothetical protein
VLFRIDPGKRYCLPEIVLRKNVLFWDPLASQKRCIHQVRVGYGNAKRPEENSPSPFHIPKPVVEPVGVPELIGHIEVPHPIIIVIYVIQPTVSMLNTALSLTMHLIELQIMLRKCTGLVS